MPERPSVAAFDSNETIFSLLPVRQRLESMGLPAESFQLWFAQLLRDGFGLTCSGDSRSFLQVAASTLETLLYQHAIIPTQERVDAVLAAFAELDPHPDVAPAMDALRGQGVRIVILTNSAASTQQLIKRAGLAQLVEKVFSADEVRRWKPHPAPYLHVAEAMGIEPQRLALLAVHGWDILGTRRAGLVTGWASQLEGRFPPALGHPDVSGATLIEITQGLLTLPAGA